MLGLRQNHFLLVNIRGLLPSLASHFVYFLEGVEKKEVNIALFIETGALVQYTSDLLEKSDNIFKKTVKFQQNL